jgi:hypothetical protein
MHRLTWVELTALGILAFAAINIAARYGAMAGLLGLLVLFLALRCFIADHRTDEQLDRLEVERDAARADAAAVRIRKQIRAGRWT